MLNCRRGDRTIAGEGGVASDIVDGYAGDAMVLDVVCAAVGLGIERGFAIHQKPVVVFARIQLDFALPRSIGHSFHWMGIRVPIIEIAGQIHRFGIGCVAGEGYRIDGLLCREVLGSARRGNCCGMHLFRLWFRSEMLDRKSVV